MAPTALAVRGSPYPAVGQRPRLTPCLCGDPWHAITSAARRGCAHSSKASARPISASTCSGLRCCNTRGYTACRSGAFFSFVDHRGGADMQHARGIANATRVEGHSDALRLALRRLTGVGIRQPKGAPMPLEARTAPLAVRAFRRHTMLANSGPLAIRAVQHWRNHRGSLSQGWFCAAPTPIQDRRSTALKHLPHLDHDGR